MLSSTPSRKPWFPLTLSGKSGVKKRQIASSWLTSGPAKGCALASRGEGHSFLQVQAEGAPVCLREQVQRRPPSPRGRRACVRAPVCASNLCVRTAVCVYTRARVYTCACEGLWCNFVSLVSAGWL